MKFMYLTLIVPWLVSCSSGYEPKFYDTVVIKSGFYKDCVGIAKEPRDNETFITDVVCEGRFASAHWERNYNIKLAPELIECGD